jgi:hypothetical protein
MESRSVSIFEAPVRNRHVKSTLETEMPLRWAIRVFLTLLAICMLLNLGPESCSSTGTGETSVEIWPLIPDGVTFLLIGAFSLTMGGWLWTRTKDSEGGKILARCLLPLSAGFGVDVSLLAVLKLLRPNLDVPWLRSFEEHTLWLRVQVQEFNDLSFRKSLLILAALLLLNWFLPKWKPVSRFLFVQQCASMLFVALMGVTTFSFFAQAPLKQRAMKNQKLMITDYEVNLREEWNQVGKYLAAKTIGEAARQLSPTDRRHFTAYLQAIGSAANKAPSWPASPGSRFTLREAHPGETIDYEGLVAQVMVKHSLHSAAPQSDTRPSAKTELHEPHLPEERALQSIPMTVDELRAQLHVVEKQRSRAAMFADQAKEALKALVAAGPGAALPELDGIAGAYFKSAVDALGDWFSSLAENWSREAGGHLRTADLLQRLKTFVVDTFSLVRRLMAPPDSTTTLQPSPSETRETVEMDVEKLARDAVPSEVAKSTNPDRSSPDRIPDLIHRRMTELEGEHVE